MLLTILSYTFSEEQPLIQWAHNYNSKPIGQSQIDQILAELNDNKQEDHYLKLNGAFSCKCYNFGEPTERYRVYFEEKKDGRLALFIQFSNGINDEKTLEKAIQEADSSAFWVKVILFNNLPNYSTIEIGDKTYELLWFTDASKQTFRIVKLPSQSAVTGVQDKVLDKFSLEETSRFIPEMVSNNYPTYYKKGDNISSLNLEAYLWHLETPIKGAYITGSAKGFYSQGKRVVEGEFKFSKVVSPTPENFEVEVAGCAKPIEINLKDNSLALLDATELVDDGDKENFFEKKDIRLKNDTKNFRLDFDLYLSKTEGPIFERNKCHAAYFDIGDEKFIVYMDAKMVEGAYMKTEFRLTVDNENGVLQIGVRQKVSKTSEGKFSSQLEIEDPLVFINEHDERIDLTVSKNKSEKLDYSSCFKEIQFMNQITNGFEIVQETVASKKIEEHPKPTEQSKEEDKKGFPWLYVGIGGGVAAVVVLLLVAFLCCGKGKKNRRFVGNN